MIDGAAIQSLNKRSLIGFPGRADGSFCCTDGVQIHFVTASVFELLNAISSGEQIESNVQHMAPRKDGSQNVAPKPCSNVVPNTIGILLTKVMPFWNGKATNEPPEGFAS